jgi:hypothetical protein
MRQSRTVFLASVILVSIATAVSEPQQSLTPGQILARMRDAYANCTSYRDEGRVVSAYDDISFATVFERPFKFRFEYTKAAPSHRYAIWRTASGNAQSWWTLRPEMQSQTMNIAVAAATGVSAASSHNIPRLLMPAEVEGFSFATDNWVDVAVPAEETVNGRLCYKLSGRYPLRPTMPVTVWIDKETFWCGKFFQTAQPSHIHRKSMYRLTARCLSFSLRRFQTGRTSL